MESNISIDVRNLTKKFGDFVAVDNIEIQVRKGEIFGILGPNGAGKTTTIRMLCGLLLPTKAEGKVNNFDIMKNPEDIKKSIGYVSQKFSLYEDLTSFENLSFYEGIYRVKEKNVKEWVIKTLELEEYKNKTAGKLPLGIRQRLALGCAIMHKPEILFLDEPTSGTDPVYRRSFWDIIYKFSSEKKTIVLTTHYLEEAEFCENIALIFNGKIILKGRPNQLKENYKKDNLEEIFIECIKDKE